jgi:hypothetical protein
MIRIDNLSSVRPVMNEKEKYVFDVLTSGLSGAELARKYGKTRAAISLVKLGKSHVNTLPELPRPRSCKKCIHWLRESCGYGFPEAIDENFATYCNVYQ